MLRLRTLPALLLVLSLTYCSSTQPVAEATPPPVAEVVEEPASEPEPTPEPAPMPTPEDAPDDWFHLDAEADNFRGVSSERAYAELLQNKVPKRTVVVAVIDSGIDIEHDDLDDKIWVNDDEIPGNNIDDDGNGYIDDVNGWNFIGGRDGRNVAHDTLELTREYALRRAKYEGVDSSTLTGEALADYEYYLSLKEELERKRQGFENQYPNVRQFHEAAIGAGQALQNFLGVEELTPENVSLVPDSLAMLNQARQLYEYMFANDISVQDLEDYRAYLESNLNYRYNPDYDSREIVGDNYEDVNERGYGNPDVAGPDPEHGTHVAGIIGAERDNNLGMDGVAAPVRIMAIRAVPDGDERDKDVANAIRYAVDNGAHVINMSFGKGYSPYKEVVDAAVRYAEARGVLLVHGAGNDASDIDVGNNFPNRTYAGGTEQASNWLEVGATDWKNDVYFVAPFSNYGQANVDLFAPGVDIYSTLPGQAFGDRQGTSMAAPVVAGVAALVMAYYPNLTAQQVRTLLMETAVPYGAQMVVLPGSENEAAQQVPFGTLSVSGGVVNAYRALQRAAEMAQ